MHDGVASRNLAARLLLTAALALLVGCEQVEAPPPTELTRPAVIIQVTPSDVASGLRFPGRVRAVQRAELTFNVPGQVIELPVAEGQQVAAGQLIARLDPSSFDTRLAAARAEFEKAATDYERVRKIWEQSQAVAEAEVDRKRTAMEVARSGYAAARKDLEDTRLLAPFAGIIARRHIENFQNVQGREPVVSLQNLDELEIVVHVPERVVRSEPRRAAAYAVFDGRPDRRLPVTLKAFATEADPQTQTYEVVLGLVRPQDMTVLPGMAAEVLPQDAVDTVGAGSLLIPLQAIDAGPDGAPAVWIVEPQTSRVTRRAVEVGKVRGSEVVVLGGLKAGERIVTTGVNHLREGMPVRPL